MCDKSTKAQKGENEKDRVYYSYQIYLKRLPTDYTQAITKPNSDNALVLH